MQLHLRETMSLVLEVGEQETAAPEPQGIPPSIECSDKAVREVEVGGCEGALAYRDNWA